jgi:phosphonatase-like hydrolase
MIQLAAFDMAGTTIDDHGHVYSALRECVLEAGASVAATDLQAWMGVDKVTAITALLRLGGVPPTPGVVSAAFDRFRVILDVRYLADPPVALPGVEAALAELRGRGIKVALTTGFSADVSGPLLESLGWTVGPGTGDTVDAVVTASDVPAGRPAPYLIHHAMEKTGVLDVRRVLAAGDTVVDLQAAVNSGAIAVGVLTGQLERDGFLAHTHDYILESVVETLGLAETQPV